MFLVSTCVLCCIIRKQLGKFNILIILLIVGCLTLEIMIGTWCYFIRSKKGQIELPTEEFELNILMYELDSILNVIVLLHMIVIYTYYYLVLSLRTFLLTHFHEQITKIYRSTYSFSSEELEELQFTYTDSVN